MYKHLLIATDGSPLADKAVEQGVALAKALSARTTVVTATEPWTAVVSGEMAISFPVDEYDKSMAAHAAGVLARAEAVARRADVACKIIHVKDRFAAEAIVDAAKAHGCDLIVVASHGRRGLTRLLLGSQTNKVLVQSTIPILVCK
jgi:nucleotide-binding universal stress UspA family protein